jgi:uncharacterized phiE125 gp8 family phage protein
MPINLNLKTAPASELITLAEAKLFLRVDHSLEDDLINFLIKASRQECEAYCSRSFASQTYQLYLDNFTSSIINLPRPSLVSVTHIKYYDYDGNQITVSASDYFVDTKQMPGRIVFKNTFSLPTLETDRPSAIEIEYVSGFSGEEADLALLAMRLCIAHWYEHREAVVLQYSVAMEVPLGVKNLLNKLRIYNV